MQPLWWKYVTLGQEDLHEHHQKTQQLHFTSTQAHHNALFGFMTYFHETVSNVY
jgi:hypothetical protein